MGCGVTQPSIQNLCGFRRSNGLGHLMRKDWNMTCGLEELGGACSLMALQEDVCRGLGTTRYEA